MFDIGFWELLLIGVVALLVIGPERLPKVARTAGLWFGRMRRFVGNVKADIDRELRAEELKRIMEEQARSSGLHTILEETRSSIESGRAGLESLQGDLIATGRELADTDRPIPSTTDTSLSVSNSSSEADRDDSNRTVQPPRSTTQHESTDSVVKSS